MIDITKLTKEDIGRWVEYDGVHKAEIGCIKSWNGKFIFVVYKCDHQWDRFQDYTGCATSPENLEFTTRDKKEIITYDKGIEKC